jgi:GNAT superfamily N-acetyltransferase
MNILDRIQVRDATPDDHAVIVEFSLGLALETEGKILDPFVLAQGVTTALAEPDRLRFWVACRDDRVVGQAAITREWSDWRNGWIWWLQSVYVAADMRSQGVFRLIYGHIRKAAQAESDVLGLRLYVEENNTRAQATYLALGMEPGGYLVYEEMWIAARR